MGENSVQLPRYTSTPRAGRDTLNVLQNFNEVSPIFPAPDIVRKTKSSIPVLLKNRSTGEKFSEAKTKVSTVTSNNSTGHGSSGSVKIPLQPRKLQTELVNQEGSQASVNKSPRLLNLGSEVKSKSAAGNNNSSGLTKKSIQVKPTASKSVPTKEATSSVDEVIDNVVGAQAGKDTKPSAGESNSQVSEEEMIVSSSSAVKLPSISARNKTEEAHTKPCRVSKSAQRPSTLPAVPEETALPGGSQVFGEDIFKSSKAQSGWLIPKETKNRVSLKRKSNVTLTKRVHTTESNHDQDGESLFGSPELPNLIETTSLVDGRKTHVVKKKPKTTDIQEENVANCENSNENPCEKTGTNKLSNLVASKSPEIEVKQPFNESKKLQPKKKSRKESNNTENIEKIGSPSIVTKKKRKMASQLEEQLKDCVDNNLDNNKKPKSSGSDIQVSGKPIETEKTLDQQINSYQDKENEAGVNIDQSKEKSKKRMCKSEKKYDSSKSNLDNAETVENNSRPKRTLRERKPNLNYEDTSYVNSKDEKGTTRKNKKEQTIKSSEDLKDSCKKMVKGTKKKNNVNSVTSDKSPFKIEEITENTANVQTVDEKEPEEENTKKRNAPKNSSKKKNTKLQSILDNESSVEKKTLQDATIQKESNSQKPVVNKDIAVTSAAKNTKRTNRSRKQCSPVKDCVSQGNEDNQNLVSTDNENVESDLQRASSTKTIVSPKIKQSRKKVTRKRSVKDTDANSSPRANKEKDADEILTSAKTNTEETEETTSKVTHKQGSKSHSKAKTKSGIAPEHSPNGKSNKLTQGSNCPETGRGVLSSGKKRKSEELDFGDSHSGPGSSSKRLKCVSDKESDAEMGRFNINDLFGTHKITTEESQPGITTVKSLHIQRFLLMGEVKLDPGAVLTKISTNTGYTVLEGSARVTIQKVTRNFQASDEHRRFFIPRNIDVTITNPGGVPLKMEFFKFRGKP